MNNIQAPGRTPGVRKAPFTAAVGRKFNANVCARLGVPAGSSNSVVVAALDAQLAPAKAKARDKARVVVRAKARARLARRAAAKAAGFVKVRTADEDLYARAFGTEL